MKQPIRLLLVEDSSDDAYLVLRELGRAGLEVQHHGVATPEGLRSALENGQWDLVISDYSLPAFDGMQALAETKRLRPELPFLLVSGSIGEERAVAAMKAGADDYVMKSNLRRLGPAVERELREAAARKEKRRLEGELASAEERLRRFRRFFSPQVAELVATSQLSDPFEWHRREVTVLFVDLRGFTSYVERSEPEEVVETLHLYYSELAKLVQEYGGTLGHVAGDGVMVFFNDPVEQPDASSRAVRMALELRSLMTGLQGRWRAREVDLGFGAAIASGHATIGGLGTDGCWDYSVIGTVTNLASRLCDEAREGQILVPQRFMTAVDSLVEAEPLGQLALKGIQRPVSIYNVLNGKPAAAGGASA